MSLFVHTCAAALLHRVHNLAKHHREGTLRDPTWGRRVKPVLPTNTRNVDSSGFKTHLPCLKLLFPAFTFFKRAQWLLLAQPIMKTFFGGHKVGQEVLARSVHVLRLWACLPLREPCFISSCSSLINLSCPSPPYPSRKPDPSQWNVRQRSPQGPPGHLPEPWNTHTQKKKFI